MSETGKKTAKKTGSAKKATAARRDAYDGFLDAPVKKSASSGTGAKKTASKKTGTSSQRGGKAGAAKVEPGIGMKADVQKKSVKSTSPKTAEKKPSAKKTTKTAETKSSSKKPATRTSAAAKSTKASAAKKQPAVRENPVGRRQAVLAVDNRPDAYDEFLMEAQQPPRTKSAKRRKKRTGATMALLVCILCIVGLGVWQTLEYREFLMMKKAVENQHFYDGTTVEGIDVSGMTLAQAMEHWETVVEPSYSDRSVTLSNGAVFTAKELGYTSDYATVISNAWSAGRSGSLEERYEMLSSRRESPVSYTVTRRKYSPEAVSGCVDAIAKEIDRPAKNASIDSFDMQNYTFSFSEAQTGSRLDAQALEQSMIAALESGGGTAELVVNAIQPETTKDDIASKYGMITSAVTNASSSSSNRLANIRLALQLIHGTKLAPGETFSFNETVGKRTEARGFKVATAYSSGEVTEDVGGGICQVSTTLFNAAVKADLEIVERHNHSLTVGYVDRGKDAAVNWNSQDLRFTNTTDDDIYICCLLSSDKRVRVGIFGQLLPNGESIIVEGEETGVVPYETVYQPSLMLAPGEMRVVQSGKNGSTAVAYKVRLDANGKRIESELLCRSSYKAMNEIVEYGPQ